MWVTGSVMWAAPSDESLKFGVQGASATNWFPRVNGARDNGIRLYFDKNFIEFCSPRSNFQYSSIGSDNGFTPARQQAITWANDG